MLIGAAAFNEERDQSERGVACAGSERAQARGSRGKRERATLSRGTAGAGACEPCCGDRAASASIAHEVNQPTTAVVASAEAALRWLDRQPPELDAVRPGVGSRRPEWHSGKRGYRANSRSYKKEGAKKGSPGDQRNHTEVIELTQAEAARRQVSVQTAFAEGLPEVSWEIKSNCNKLRST